MFSTYCFATADMCCVKEKLHGGVLRIQSLRFPSAGDIHAVILIAGHYAVWKRACKQIKGI